MPPLAAIDSPVWASQEDSDRYTRRAQRLGTTQLDMTDHVDHIPPYDEDVFLDHNPPPVSELKPATEGSWRRDSPMEHSRQGQPTWRNRTYAQPKDSVTSMRSTGYLEPREQKEPSNEYPVMQSKPPPAQGDAYGVATWAASGNAPAPRRMMNFSRPMRKEEESASNRTIIIDDTLDEPEVKGGRQSTSDDDEVDAALERRLNNLKMRESTRTRNTDRSRGPPSHQIQQQSTPYSQLSPRQTNLPQSGKAYTRPTLSPIPSMASAITLSQLRRQHETLQEDIDEDVDLDSATPRLSSETERNVVQPSASASSSTTSFASQLAPVPPSHYPGASPLASPEAANREEFIAYSPLPITRAPPPSISSYQDSTPTASPFANKTNFTSTGRSSSSGQVSAHTSATTSSQPSMDIDRIAPVLSSPPASPAAHQNLNRYSLNKPASISSNPSLSRVPVRTNSTTSSGATSAMEAFKASNYDVSTLTDSQIAKLKKKGVDPALYMEMKAATGGMRKDGKKRSKWSRALVGNTFIG
jgi:hypothetical protein